MRPKRRIGRGRLGMSLAEVLIALSILALMMTAITGTFMYTTRMNTREQAITHAVQLSTMVLEEKKQLVVDGSEFDSLKSTSYAVYVTEDNLYANYVYDIEVDQVSVSLKYVGVTVYYRKANDLSPDLSRPNMGKITTIGTYLLKPY